MMGRVRTRAPGLAGLRARFLHDAMGRQARKPRVVIVGCGWAGFRFAQDLDKDKYDVHLVSPRNHFLFTPLLPSTAVGTLEFRAIQEPVRTIAHLHYSQAEAKAIDFDASQLLCADAFTEGHDFSLPFDVLVLATGAQTNTFRVAGVENNPHVFFLKQLQDARSIRNRLIDCFERASSPALEHNEAEKRKLLTFVIVGGGPTSVEFAAELYDFLKEDVSRWYPDLHHLASVKIVEASGHILGSFKSSLVSYVERLFRSRKIELMTEVHVKEVLRREDEALLSNGERIPFGLMVWSTGIKQVPLIDSLSPQIVAKFPTTGRLQVDKHLRVLRGDITMNNNNSTNNNNNINSNSTITAEDTLGKGAVFAMGDCAADRERPLPALAQVAMQQGKYLARLLNEIDDIKDIDGSATNKVFRYQHLGSMASVGQWKGVFDAPSDSGGPPVQGLTAFLLWRAAYWTKQVSLVNKMLIPMYWFKAMLFGRDISKF